MLIKNQPQIPFKSRFNEVKQKYFDFCHIYTDGSKIETKVTSAYACPYGTRGYRLRDGCSIFTAEVEAINKALKCVKVSTRKSFLIFSDSTSVLQAIESHESKNPLVNRVLLACQEILSNGKLITFCWLPCHRDIRGNEGADRAGKRCCIKSTAWEFRTSMYRLFLWKSSLLSYLCGRNSGMKRWITNCTPSCPKLMTSISLDAQIEKMKLLLIAFE